jgi:phosphatidylethanolamine/phosphatidyl-N-methylethanolamine N-methyltransferase
MTIEIDEFYGRWADLYDAIATAPGVGKWRAGAADALDLSRGDTVVEMGCGTGANIPYLRSRVGPEGRVVGIDLTPQLLDRARTRTERAGWTNVHLVRGDASRPPVTQADAILTTFVVGLLPDPASAVETWCNIATGRVALLDGASSHHPVGQFANPLFGVCVSVGAPADSVGETIERLPTSSDARRQLDTAVRASRNSLVASTTDRRYETFGLGFVGLLSGK